MSSGSKALRKIQLGIESSPGTAVAATSRLIATLNMEQQQKYARPTDLETGRFSAHEYSQVVGVLMKGDLEAIATYRQLLHFLGMTAQGSITGSGGGSPYLWTYEPNLTSLDVLDAYTIEYGDEVAAFRSPFCFGGSLNLTGTVDDALRVKIPVYGQFVESHAFTGALSNPLPAAYTPIAMNNLKAYIDTSWAGLGGTQASKTVYELDLKLAAENGDAFQPLKYGDGNLYYSAYSQQKRRIALDATVGFNSTSSALFAGFIAAQQTKYFIRLEWTGPAISGGNNKLTIDGSYIIDKFPSFTERNGENTVKLSFLSEYDSTSGKEWSIRLTNDINAVP